jgi:hypothetical protein
MSLIEKARVQRELILKAMEILNDQDASRVPEFYTTLKYDGSFVPNGARVNWNGVLKKAVVDIWDREENNPDNAPTLWVNIDYKDGVRIIPATITVSTMFAKDELGWWNDILYKSLVDANVYTPDQYAANWIVVE